MLIRAYKITPCHDHHKARSRTGLTAIHFIEFLKEWKTEAAFDHSNYFTGVPVGLKVSNKILCTTP